MIGLNKIIHADCMDVMKEIPDKWFELAIVDPPYGMGAAKEKCSKIFKRGNGTTGYRVRPEHKKKDWDNKIPDKKYFDELFRVSKNQIIWGGNYFNLLPSRCFLIWDKCNRLETFSDCEMAWTSFINPAKLFKHDDKGFMSKDGLKIHPTQKPIALYRWLLQNYAKPNDKIIDTHSGSGSCAIACFLAIEKDEDYYKASVARYNEVISQGRLF